MKKIIPCLILCLILFCQGCTMPTENWVCGPVRLHNSDRTILIGFNSLLDSFNEGHLEFFAGDEYTHRVEITPEFALVEYFEQTAGRDEAGIHHNWHNLRRCFFDRRENVLIKSSFR
ncbi:MAG: hypothetical protein MI749_10035, partial [Desulfovibrionales bacterium]|nr:hypothetical protein [Desulfovibrionales bacterium]